VGGSQLKLATSAKISSTRAGFGAKFSAQKLKLTAKLATRLNKKLRPKVPFTANQPLGTLITDAQPQLVTVLESGRATLVFDPGFESKLNSLFVSLNPIFPAEHVGSTFTFPIVIGGAIAPDASQGTLRTGGDVELLQLGGGQVFWHELWLDLGAKVDSAEANLPPSTSFSRAAKKTSRPAKRSALSASPRRVSRGARTLPLSTGGANFRPRSLR
jgi:hypothetical protein